MPQGLGGHAPRKDETVFIGSHESGPVAARIPVPNSSSVTNVFAATVDFCYGGYSSSGDCAQTPPQRGQLRSPALSSRRSMRRSHRCISGGSTTRQQSGGHIAVSAYNDGGCIGCSDSRNVGPVHLGDRGSSQSPPSGVRSACLSLSNHSNSVGRAQPSRFEWLRFGRHTPAARCAFPLNSTDSQLEPPSPMFPVFPAPCSPPAGHLHTAASEAVSQEGRSLLIQPPLSPALWAEIPFHQSGVGLDSCHQQGDRRLGGGGGSGNRRERVGTASSRLCEGRRTRDIGGERREERPIDGIVDAGTATAAAAASPPPLGTQLVRFLGQAEDRYSLGAVSTPITRPSYPTPSRMSRRRKRRGESKNKPLGTIGTNKPI